MLYREKQRWAHWLLFKWSSLHTAEPCCIRPVTAVTPLVVVVAVQAWYLSLWQMLKVKPGSRLHYPWQINRDDAYFLSLSLETTYRTLARCFKYHYLWISQRLINCAILYQHANNILPPKTQWLHKYILCCWRRRYFAFCRGELEVELVRSKDSKSMQPLCMSQHYQMLRMYRRPGRQLDEQLLLDRATSGDHIIVAHHNQVHNLSKGFWNVTMRNKIIDDTEIARDFFFFFFAVVQRASEGFWQRQDHGSRANTADLEDYGNPSWSENAARWNTHYCQATCLGKSQRGTSQEWVIIFFK